MRLPQEGFPRSTRGGRRTPGASGPFLRRTAHYPSLPPCTLSPRQAHRHWAIPNASACARDIRKWRFPGLAEGTKHRTGTTRRPFDKERTEACACVQPRVVQLARAGSGGGGSAWAPYRDGCPVEPEDLPSLLTRMGGWSLHEPRIAPHTIVAPRSQLPPGSASVARQALAPWSRSRMCRTTGLAGPCSAGTGSHARGPARHHVRSRHRPASTRRPTHPDRRPGSAAWRASSPCSSPTAALPHRPEPHGLPAQDGLERGQEQGSRARHLIQDVPRHGTGTGHRPPAQERPCRVFGTIGANGERSPATIGRRWGAIRVMWLTVLERYP